MLDQDEINIISYRQTVGFYFIDEVRMKCVNSSEKKKRKSKIN